VLVFLLEDAEDNTDLLEDASFGFFRLIVFVISSLVLKKWNILRCLVTHKRRGSRNELCSILYFLKTNAITKWWQDSGMSLH